jgi:hypothetical protein
MKVSIAVVTTMTLVCLPLVDVELGAPDGDASLEAAAAKKILLKNEGVV